MRMSEKCCNNKHNNNNSDNPLTSRRTIFYPKIRIKQTFTNNYLIFNFLLSVYRSHLKEKTWSKDKI